MKVRIEIEEGLAEEEVVIRCGKLNDSVVSLQNYISKQNDGKRCLSLTDGQTADKIFSCGYKLYELEELLPGSFMRISKSSIANLDFVYSITRNLTASSLMGFVGSGKKAMVSRAYYKAVAERLKTRKLGL